MIEPRVILTVDYESWTTLRLSDGKKPSSWRRELDEGFVLDSLQDILSIFDKNAITFFLSGEAVSWFPEIPIMIEKAGHEVGFHAHGHRKITQGSQIISDFEKSDSWLKKCKVTGFRSPIVTLPSDAYTYMADLGFEYSSSTYAPVGTHIEQEGIWELPISTEPIFGKTMQWQWPRNLSLSLLLQGELPYGSGFMIPILGEKILKWIEKCISSGKSPVLVLHNFQLVQPEDFFNKIFRGKPGNVLQLLYLINCRELVLTILRNFQVSRMDQWLAELKNG